MQSASPQPGSLLGLIRARACRSPCGTSFGCSMQPRPPSSGGEGGPAYLRGGGFLPLLKCLDALSTSTPINSYTSTLLRHHPCRHGRSSVRLQVIHMHYRERFVLLPAHDYSSPVQHFVDECWAVQWELQFGSAVSSQRYVVNSYQLSGLVLSSLHLAVIVMFLMQRHSLQSLAGVPVCCPQSVLACSHILTHSPLLFVRPQGRPVHGLIGSRLCWPSIIMLGVTPVLASGVAR